MENSSFLSRSNLFLFLFFVSIHMLPQTTSEESLVKSHDDMELQWGPCPEFMPEGCTLTVLHGDPALRNADLLLKVPANSEIAQPPARIGRAYDPAFRRNAGNV